MASPIGINTWVWSSPPTDALMAEVAPKAKDMGFDLLELPVENAGDWDPARTGELLASLGLGASLCAARAPGRDLTEPSTVEATQGYLRWCIDALAACGGGAVAGPLYTPVGDTPMWSASERSAALGRLVENLKPLADYAGERGVTLAVEPLNRFETSVLNTAEQTMEVVSRVDHPALGVLLDSFHMNVEEKDQAAAIRLVGSKLAHFHACGNDRGAPGQDHIAWDTIRDALREVGYQGALVIESFTPGNESIAKAAAIWRPLAPSQDDLARDGLAFLRGLGFAGA
ncbi:MAG TPA: sugar phosphate isomerase/epimerase family protein [Thermomicrobiales bacterium]|nr:sugar phosphate isomerase/epimerase family protein [Thermomicrobiales bacterium]